MWVLTGKSWDVSIQKLQRSRSRRNVTGLEKEKV
jgi:hypothetical protein